MTRKPPGRVLARDHWPEDHALRVDAYRFDARAQLLRVWLCGLGSVYGGMAVAWLGPLSSGSSPTLARLAPWLGFAAFAIGLASVVRGLCASLCREHYVSLRTDGIVLREQAEPRWLSWDEIEDVAVEPHGQVALTLRCGAVHSFDASPFGVDARLLAQRIAHVRRRALWGLYDARAGE